MNTTIDESTVWTALSGILDPEFGLSIVDLGLVYSVACSEGLVRVAMTLTTPACPASNYIVEGARATIAALPGVLQAQVDLVWEPMWTPELLSDGAREALGWKPQR